MLNERQLVDAHLFGTAHVHLGGFVMTSIHDHKQAIPFLGDYTLITLHAAGLGWCIETPLW